MLATNMLGGLQIPIPLAKQMNKTMEQTAKIKPDQLPTGSEDAKGTKVIINMSNHMRKRTHYHSNRQMKLSIKTSVNQRNTNPFSTYDKRMTHNITGHTGKGA